MKNIKDKKNIINLPEITKKRKKTLKSKTGRNKVIKNAIYYKKYWGEKTIFLSENNQRMS